MTLRKHFSGFAISALALAVSAQALAGTVTTDGADIVISTKSGLEVSTTDKQFSFKLGGKLQWDVTSFDGLRAAGNPEPFGTTTDSFIRRGELSLEGVAYKNWGYGFRFAYDDEDDTKFDRAFFTYTGFEPVQFTIGKFRVDYGLEKTTSSSWITGIERGFMYDFLNGDEDTEFGVTAFHGGENYGLMATLANRDEKEEDGNKDTYQYTLRGTFAPYLDGTDVIHLGVNYHNSNPDDKAKVGASTRMGIRSDDDNKLKFAETTAENDSEWVLESGAQFGAFRAQAEVWQRSIDGKAANSDIDMSGYYGQVSYMFNGVRKYKPGVGKWDKPSEAGAIEVFARYENANIDADTGAVKSSLMSNGVLAAVPVQDTSDDFDAKSFVIGVNYFPTPAVRVSLNYVDYEVDNIDTSATVKGKSVEDDGKAIVGRLQYVF